MDGKLARGYARQSLRNFEQSYPAALKALSRDLFPYYDDLCRKRKLSRQRAKEAVAAFARHIRSQPHIIWMERFDDTRHPKLSTRFGEGLHCLRLNLARCHSGGAALIAHADLMLATRGKMEFRSADLAVAITDHALARLLERGDERIAAFAPGLMPGLLIAKLSATLATAGPQPIAIPHPRGLFLGHCEYRHGHAEWCAVHTRIFDDGGEHDVQSAPVGAQKGGVGPVAILSTFVGEAEMSHGQRQLRDELSSLAERHGGALLDHGLADALYRPLGESLVAGRDIDLAGSDVPGREFHSLANSPLWQRTVRRPETGRRSGQAPAGGTRPVGRVAGVG